MDGASVCVLGARRCKSLRERGRVRRGGGRRKERGEVDTSKTYYPPLFVGVRGETKGKKEEGTEGGVRQRGIAARRARKPICILCPCVPMLLLCQSQILAQ